MLILLASILVQLYDFYTKKGHMINYCGATWQALIEEGAVELVVPGNLPIGCSALYLTLFRSPNEAVYDKRNGCLKAYNAFSKYHNSELKRALGALRLKYPHARIIYADYYGAAMPLSLDPRHYGKLQLPFLLYFIYKLWSTGSSTHEVC